MVGRLLVYLGALIASTVVNAVTGLAVSGSAMTPEAWVVSGLVPFALLLIYALWIEPRHQGARVRGRRYRKAVDAAAERAYKLDPAHNISQHGLLFEDASDPFRKDWYRELGIPDLFEPDPRKGEKLLNGKAAQLTEMIANVEKVGFTPKLMDALVAWERATAGDVEFYQRGLLARGHAAGFTKHSFALEGDEARKLKRLNEELREVQLYAKDQAKAAASR